MDRVQEDIQFLGFFGIFKEAFNITTSYRKIFSRIILFLILPFSFNYFAHINKFLILDKIERHSMISDVLSSLIFTLILPLFLYICWTSAVVYTIACTYTAKEVTYKTAMKVVPKVWKRLMITSILNFVIYLALIFGALLVIILWGDTLGPSPSGIMVAIILLIYLSGVVYLSFVCYLANVISVLEELYGFQAMLKSKYLIKGNTGLCAAIFLIHDLCFLGIHLGFKASAVGEASFWGMMSGTFLWSMLMSMLVLFGLVVQTIIYLNCKSYHSENIYVQLESQDVQLEHSTV